MDLPDVGGQDGFHQAPGVHTSQRINYQLKSNERPWDLCSHCRPTSAQNVEHGEEERIAEHQATHLLLQEIAGPLAVIPVFPPNIPVNAKFIRPCTDPVKE